MLFCSDNRMGRFKTISRDIPRMKKKREDKHHQQDDKTEEIKRTKNQTEKGRDRAGKHLLKTSTRSIDFPTKSLT